MQPELYTETLLWWFLLSMTFGVVANKTNFCTMGAISDWINFGDLNRMRSWGLAMSTAILGVGILEYSGLLDMSLTTSTETSNPPYRTPNFVWLRYLVGGVLFGIGMTLSSGCGNKTLIRLGEGNLKSLFVLIIMALAASVMLFTSIDYWVFLQWMSPLGINFSDYGISGQDLGSVIVGITDAEASALYLLLPALLIGIALLAWVMSAAGFRANRELVIGGFIIGILVVIAWYITAGSFGQALLEELEFMDMRPYAAGAQSFSFVAPSAHTGQYIYQGFSPAFLSIGVVTVCGVAVGSFLFTLFFRKVRLEWFVSWSDFIRHALGSVLMGVGGVLAMGCTIGQGISGVATLALGSFVTVIAIVAGCAGTMKYQYYRMMREDD